MGSNPHYVSDYECRTPEGIRFERFCGMLRHFRGDYAGKPFILEPWQKKIFDELLGTKDESGKRQYDTTFMGLPRKTGKELPLDTTLITPTGTTTMGEVKVGDDLVGLDGLPCRVIAKSEVDHDPDAYEVEFSTGEVILCDGNHDWTVSSRDWGRSPGSAKYRVMSARELHQSNLHRGKAWRFKVPSVVYQGEHRDLPLPPYILGSWLGDGFTAKTSVCGLRDDLSPLFDELAKTGWDWDVKDDLGGNNRHDFCHARVRGVRDLWRSAGFMDGHRKHIPEIYMHASVSQRIALLQGLLDTDGHCTERGQIGFTQKDGQLINDVQRLLASLGIYVKIGYYPDTFNGSPAGTRCIIRFTAPAWLTNPFRIPRKNARVKPSETDGTRKIVAVRHCPDRKVPMQCVQVVGGNYLCDNFVPTHNSTMVAALGLYMLLLDGEEGAEIAVAAGDRAQAGILFDMAKRFVESCPSLSSRVKLYRNSIAVPSTSSRFITVSSDAGMAHGLNLSCAVVDEAHVHKSRELADTLISSMGSRRQPLAVYITTAGFNLGGWAHREFRKAVKIQDGTIESPHYYPFVAAASPEDDPFSFETALKANPNLGVSIKPDYIEKWIEKAKTSTSDEVTYRTLHLNQWLSSENRWLKAEDFPKVMTPLSPDRSGPAFIGVDLSSIEDTTAVSIIFPQDDGTVDIECTCYIPGDIAARKEDTDRVPYRDWAKNGWVRLTNGDVVDYDLVTEDIMALCDKYDVRAIAVDRWNAQSVIAALQYEALPVTAYSQSIGSMSPPTKLLHTKILRQEVRAGDNEALRWQFTNAAVKSDINENIKVAKPSPNSPERVDMVVATIMAFGVGGSHITDPNDMRIEIL